MIKTIIKKLDRIAHNLENKGYIKEATYIDIVSNTLEEIEKDKWQARTSPQYFLLESVKRILRRNDIKEALKLLNKNQYLKEAIIKKYKDNRGTKIFADSYDKLIDELENNNITEAKRLIDQAQNGLIVIETTN